MTGCDVLVAGGGPAGSTCAWKLREAGVDVLVLDRAAFPRDKPCAGWITPPVVDELALDLDEYRRGRVLQTMTGFRVGLIGGASEVAVDYGRTASFGIRRCEFDHYLLFRSRARLALGTGVVSLRRDGAAWIVNDAIRTPMIVGAGGHFCAVAARLNGPRRHDTHAPLVVAQETEFPADAESDAFPIAGDTPEFYFSEDFTGYGWCCRKQQYINVGFGRLADDPLAAERHGLPAATREFVGFLERRRRVPPARDWRWHGHAYLLRGASPRRLSAPGAVLVGDAAGLAYAQSGEGIRPAIESGLFAARTILDAAGAYDDLSEYDARVGARFGPPASTLGSRLPATVGRVLMAVPWFVRHVVLDRWFLHANEPSLAL